MANMNINITGLETIAQAINNLAQALGKGGVSASFTEAGGVSQAPPVTNFQPAATPNQGGIPVQQPGGLPVAGQAAAQPGMAYQQPGLNYQQPIPGQVPGGGIPTTATPQSYTQDQIAVALTGLIDQGKRDAVMQILGQFGAMSLMQVPAERYPELATQLRGAGANI